METRTKRHVDRPSQERSTKRPRKCVHSHSSLHNRSGELDLLFGIHDIHFRQVRSHRLLQRAQTFGTGAEIGSFFNRSLIEVGHKFLNALYIFALQPFRAISYITSHFVNLYMIFHVYTKSDDQFTKIAALILLKVWIIGGLTSYKRLSKGSSHGIPEDKIFASKNLQKKLAEKYPDGKIPKKAAGGERMMALHQDDIYNVIPFLAMIILTKSYGFDGLVTDEKLVELMSYFLYARSVQTVFVFLNLPSIFFAATQFTSIFIQFTIFHDIWSFPAKIDISDKSHLLILIIAKSVFVGVWVSIVRLFSAKTGKFWFNDAELENPEQFLDSEATRGVNCQRNNAENEAVFVLGCLSLGVAGVPLSLVYGFFVTRFVHNAAYLLHVPQPVRALSWAAGVYLTVKLLVLFF